LSLFFVPFFPLVLFVPFVFVFFRFFCQGTKGTVIPPMYICAHSTSRKKISTSLSAMHQFKHFHAGAATSVQLIGQLLYVWEYQYKTLEITRRKTEEFWYLSRGPDLVKISKDKCHNCLEVTLNWFWKSINPFDLRGGSEKESSSLASSSTESFIMKPPSPSGTTAPLRLPDSLAEVDEDAWEAKLVL
jgi:hypothetical protein